MPKKVRVVKMPPRIEMAGKTFNSLYVIEEAGKYQGQFLWRCRCTCGKETIVRGHYLRSGHTKTCGNCTVYTEENGYMKCTVGSGRHFIFDTEDYDIVKQYRWSVDKLGYVRGQRKKEGVKLHRLLMNPAKNQVVDHINRLPWDCRKENLRVTTQHKNCFNQGLSKANTTGYKGVCFDKKAGKYMAYIHPNRRFTFLGYFINPVEAAIAYNEAASFYFGEYARLNEIPVTLKEKGGSRCIDFGTLKKQTQKELSIWTAI